MEETDDETSEDETVNRSVAGENGSQANHNNATLLSSDNSSAYTRSWRMWKRKRKDNEETINGPWPVNCDHHLSTSRKRYSTRKPISENSGSTSGKRQREIEVRADGGASTSTHQNPNETRQHDVTFTYINKNFTSRSNSEESLSKKLTRQLMQKSAGSRSVYFTPSNTGLDLRTGRSYGGSEKGQFSRNQNSKTSSSGKRQSSKSDCKCAKCGRKRKSENFPKCSPSERYQSGSERPEVQNQKQEKVSKSLEKEKDPKTRRTKKEENCPEACPTLKRQNTGCNCKFKVQVKPTDSTKSPKEAKNDKATSKDCLGAKSNCQCRKSSTRIPRTTQDGNAKGSEKIETNDGRKDKLQSRKIASTKEVNPETDYSDICPVLKRKHTDCNCKIKGQVKPSDPGGRSKDTTSGSKDKENVTVSQICTVTKSNCKCSKCGKRTPGPSELNCFKTSSKSKPKNEPVPTNLIPADQEIRCESRHDQHCNCNKCRDKSRCKVVSESIRRYQSGGEKHEKVNLKANQRQVSEKGSRKKEIKQRAESDSPKETINQKDCPKICPILKTKHTDCNCQIKPQNKPLDQGGRTKDTEPNRVHDSKDKENIAVSKICTVTKTNCKCSKCGKRTPASSEIKCIETSPRLAPKKEPLKEIKPEPTNKDPVDRNREESRKHYPVQIKEGKRCQSGSEKPKSHDQLPIKQTETSKEKQQQVSRKPDKLNPENEPVKKLNEEKDCPKICPILKKSHTGCNCQIKVQMKPRDTVDHPSDTSPKGDYKEAQPIGTKAAPSKSKTSCQSKSCKGKKKSESIERVEQPEHPQPVKPKPSGQNTTCQCESCKRKKKPGKCLELQNSPPLVPKEPAETQPVKLKPTDKSTPKPSKLVKETCPCIESQARKDIPSPPPPPPKEPVETQPVKLKPTAKPSKVVKETCPCIESQATKDIPCPPPPKEPVEIQPVKLKPTTKPSKVVKETCPCIESQTTKDIPCPPSRPPPKEPVEKQPLKTKPSCPGQNENTHRPACPCTKCKRPRIPSRTVIGDPCSEDKDIHTYDCNCQTCQDPNVNKHPVEEQKKPWRLPWSCGHPVELKPKSTPVEIKPWRVSEIFRQPRIPSRFDIVKLPAKETCPCKEDKQKPKKDPCNEHPIVSKRPPVSAIFQHPRIPGVIDKPAKMTCIPEKESCPCEKPEEPCRQRGGDLIKEKPVITKPENIANMLQRPRLHEIAKIPLHLPAIPKWEKQEKCPCQDPKSEPVKTKASSCVNILRHPRIPNHDVNRTRSEPCEKEEVCQCQREKCEPIKADPVRTKPSNFESVFQHPKLHPISGPQLPSLKCKRKSKDCICRCAEEEPKPKNVQTKPWNFQSLFQNPRIPMTTSERRKRESCPCREEQPRPCDKRDRPFVEPVETKPGSILSAFQRPRIPFIMPPRRKQSCYSIQCPCENRYEKPVGESCRDTELKVKDIVRTKRSKCYTLFQHPRIPGPMENWRPPSEECSKDDECHCQIAERKPAGREPIKTKPSSSMCHRPRIPFIPTAKKSEEEFCSCKDFEPIPPCPKTETIRSSTVKTKTFDISKLLQRPRIPKGHCYPDSHGGHCTCTICQDQLECEQHTSGSGPKWQVQIPCEDRPKRRKPERIKIKTWDILNILQHPRIPAGTGYRPPKLEREERCPCSERETTKQQETCPCQTGNYSAVHPTRKKPVNIANILQKPRIPQAGFANFENHPSKCTCLICEDSSICKSQKGDGKSKSKLICPSCISKLFSDITKRRQDVVNTKPFLTSSLFQHPRIPQAIGDGSPRRKDQKPTCNCESAPTKQPVGTKPTASALQHPRIPNASDSHSHRKVCDCDICQERNICETIYEKKKRNERQTDNRHYGGTDLSTCYPNESQPILHQEQTHREQPKSTDSCKQVSDRYCCCKNCKNLPCRNRRPITEVLSRQEEDMKRKHAGEVVSKGKTEAKDCKCQICDGSGLCKHGETIKTEPKLENTSDLRPSKKCKCHNCKRGASCLKNRHDAGANKAICPPKKTSAIVAETNHIPEKTCKEEKRNCVCEKCQTTKCYGYRVTDDHHSKVNTQVAPVKESTKSQSTCKFVESCKICANRSNSTCPKDCPRPKKSEGKIKRVSSPVEVCKTGSRVPKEKESKTKKSHRSEENVPRKDAGHETPHYSKAGPSESNVYDGKKSHQKTKCACKMCKGGEMCKNVSFEKSKAEVTRKENPKATEGKCCTCPSNPDKVHCANPNCKNRR